MEQLKFIFILLVGFAFFSCNDDDSNVSSTLNGTWTLSVLYDQTDIQFGATVPNITFTDNSTFSGFGGCNQYSNGEIEVFTDTQLQLGSFTSTQIRCLNDDFEQLFFQMIDEVHFYRFPSQNIMEVLDENQEVIAIFIRS